MRGSTPVIGMGASIPMGVSYLHYVVCLSLIHPRIYSHTHAWINTCDRYGCFISYDKGVLYLPYVSFVCLSHTHIPTHILARTYTYIHPHTDAHVHECTSELKYPKMLTHVHTYTYSLTHTHTHTHTLTRTLTLQSGGVCARTRTQFGHVTR